VNPGDRSRPRGTSIKVAPTRDLGTVPEGSLRATWGQGGPDAVEAPSAATTTPARTLGLGDRVGTMGPDKDTDLVLLDEHPELGTVTASGECGYGACK
jgi:N-acetylglucosamine-6-phosphate deacetylase